MREKGFSLVEMMIALVVGMIVIAAALGTYIGTFSANSTQMKYSRLNSELRTVMTQITRDLRRAGFTNWTLAQIAAGNFLVSPQAAPVLTGTTAQIRYDENANGVAETEENYSYQWVDTNGDSAADTIQARIGAGAWTNLTDPAVIRVTNFSITNSSPAAINPTGAAAAVTVPVYTVVIAGQLLADVSVQRSIQETVRVRNPILVPN